MQGAATLDRLQINQSISLLWYECFWGVWEKPCCCAKWFLALLHSLLQAYMQPDQTRRSPPVSPQQLQGIDFFLSFSFYLSLADASSLSVLFFPPLISFKADRRQSTDSTDRKSIQSHPSWRSLNSYLDISAARGGGWTLVSLYPLVFLSHYRQPRRRPPRWLIIFFWFCCC